MKLKKMLASVLSAGMLAAGTIAPLTASAQTEAADVPPVLTDGFEFSFDYINAEEYTEICRIVEADYAESENANAVQLPQILEGKNFSSSFFYDQMTAVQKKFYDGLEEICDAFSKDFVTDLDSNFFTEGVSIDTSEMEITEACNLCVVFYYDHPQYFFLAQGWRWSSNGQRAILMPMILEEFRTGSERAKYNTAIDASANRILSRLPASADTALEKEQYIYNTLCALTEYNYDDYNAGKSGGLNQSIAGALVSPNKCVCNGYTMSVTYLLNMLGVETVGIRSATHAWNAVNLGTAGAPRWYLVDTTWMDSGSTVNLMWGNKSTASFWQNDPGGDHIPDYDYYDGAGVELPVCEYDMIFAPDGTGTDSERMPTPERPFTPTEGDIVWAGGRDVKANAKNGTPAVRYKTMTYRNVGNYSGGKWAVAVTPEEIDQANEFIALFKNGKLTANGKEIAAEAKKIASAKIKEGNITVTAGKKAGRVQVWVYELKKNPETGKNEVVSDAASGIAPMRKTVEVRAAAASPVLADPDDIMTGVLQTGKKAVTKLNLVYKEGTSSQTSETLKIADKKTAFDRSTGFTVSVKGDEGVVHARLSSGTLTINPLKAGKATVTVTNMQSGKSAKVSVTVTSAYPVTFGEGISVSYQSGKNTVTLKSGDYVPVKTKLTVSSEKETLIVTGAQMKSGKITVGEAAISITAGS